MKHLISIVTVIAMFVIAGSLSAQDSLQVKSKKQLQYKNQTKTAVQIQSKARHSEKFVDQNGDGYNDNAKDADADGIPNGQDEDYDGAKNRKGENAKGFVDDDNDGINDNIQDADGDGIPNGQDPDYVRPLNGKSVKNMNGSQKGFGQGTGTGDCDGSGPKGNQGKK